MTLRKIYKKYCTNVDDLNVLYLRVNSKDYLSMASISFHDDEEPTYNVYTNIHNRYITIGEFDEFKNQIEEVYDLLKSDHKFLSKLKLDEELTESQEITLESIVHALE